MFTVKVIHERDNSEQLFEAASVNCGLDISHPDAPRKVWVHQPDGDVCVYDVRKKRERDDQQTMFVMNRFGATVAKYQL